MKIIKEYKDFYKEKNIFVELIRRITQYRKRKFLKIICISIKRKHYKKKPLFLLIWLYYELKYNVLASKYKIYLEGDFGRKLKIEHENIFLNKNAKIGNNCVLHGNNCIGTSGNNRVPVIGDNVDIGFGATIIGDIKIVNNIVIGANSLVNKSFVEDNVVIAGNPARIIKRK